MPFEPGAAGWSGGRAVSKLDSRDVHAVPQIRSWLVVKVAEYLPPNGRRRLFERAGPELRALLIRQRDAREAWTRLGLFHEALELADALAERGDLASCWDIGRFTAGYELGVVRSFALKMLRPGTTMSLATSLWQVHYRNAGRAVVRVTGPNAVMFSLVDYPSPHRAHCLAVGGWVQGALALGPRRAIEVRKVACRCIGALSCDYAISWEEA